MKVLIACEYSGVPGYPGYRVTSDGAVQSRWRRGTRVWSDHWAYLSPRVDKKGYLSVVLCNQDGHKSIRIHRLVATAFIPNVNSLPCVRHLDGNPANNRVENLAWGTYADNENDKRKHGTWNARNGGARLTPEQVQGIRKRCNSGERHKDIADDFGVSRPTITRIANNKTWRQQ